jgi:hypothetical protein
MAADETVTAKQHKRLEGLIPCRAAGLATITMGAVTSGAANEILIKDNDVLNDMLVLATINASPDHDLVICDAVAETRAIRVTIKNMGGGNSDTGALIIGYMAI